MIAIYDHHSNNNNKLLLSYNDLKSRTRMPIR